MAVALQRFRVHTAVLLCVLLAAPLAAEAQSRKGKKNGPKRTPSSEVVKVPSTTSDAMEDSSSTSTQSGGAPSRGPTRIDFDDRLVQGQTNKSGAVYLYDRKELKQRGMVKVRESFREEIVQTVYDR